MWRNEHPDNELTAYARGALDAEQSRAVDEHLAGCERCRLELESSRSLLTQVRIATANPPALDWYEYDRQLRAKIRRSGDSIPPPERGRLVPPVMISALAAGAAIAAMLVVMFTIGPLPRDHGPQLTPVQQAMLGSQLDLLENYPVVEHLDLLEDLDVIQHLDQLSSEPRSNNA